MRCSDFEQQNLLHWRFVKCKVKIALVAFLFRLSATLRFFIWYIGQRKRAYMRVCGVFCANKFGDLVALM